MTGKPTILDELFTEYVNENDSHNNQKIIDYLDRINNKSDVERTNQLANYSNRLGSSLKNLEWLNATQPVDITVHCKGKLTLVDFWTYCCINCMHIIPLLNRLERQFEHELVVIGVHSSKFDNEKSHVNIQHAIKRHLIKHPVAVDSNLDVWTSLEIICWPTLLVVDPNGRVIAEFKGELQVNLLPTFVQVCMNYYADKLNRTKMDIYSPTPVKICPNSPSTICFPTKLLLDHERLFVSESGNNRIVVVNTVTNRFEYAIGSGRTGDGDGDFDNCEFDWPQGMAYDASTGRLYIADTFNDLIRVADLNTRQVNTVCGISSKQSSFLGRYDYTGGKPALEQSISSPWDVVLFKRDTLTMLLIACAGTHQIWMHSLSEQAFTLWKNTRFEPGTLTCIAGNGKERNKNNSYPMQASFAQPSGLCIDETGQNLFIADAESSSVRVLNLFDGSVKGLLGGDHLQPDNLFAYGDCDGKGHEVKFQHPLDVKFIQRSTGEDVNKYLILADTYNNSLKKIDIKSKTCRRIGLKSGLKFNEPNGLAIDELNRLIYVADTNNHSIKVIPNFNLTDDQFELEELFVQSVDVSDSFKQLNIAQADENLLLRVNFKLNDNANNTWKVKIKFNDESKEKFAGKLIGSNLIEAQDNFQVYKLANVLVKKLDEISSMEVKLSLIYCNQQSACKMFKKAFFVNKNDLKLSNEYKNYILINTEN